MNLAEKVCVPCAGGVPALTAAECEVLLRELPEWAVVDGHHLSRTFRYPDFISALAFVNRAAGIAEEQGHHPDILLAWGRAEVKIFTHAIDGLTESDFVLAAKVERVA